MAFYHPIYRLSSKSISLLERISRLEGEIHVSARNLANDTTLQVEAAIDSIHYSTRIEGNTLTREEVTKAVSGKQGRATHQTRDVKEILNYSKARRFLFEEAIKTRGLPLKLILETHRLLMTGILNGKLKGHLREGQNVIKDSRTNAIVYLPPEAKNVPSLITSLCKGVSSDLRSGDVSPLILAASFHYQFVTIHPFMDGNGRAARALTTYLLATQNFEFIKYASIEKQHESNRAKYYSVLHDHQRQNYYDIPPAQDIGSWIEYWLACAAKACEEAHGKIINLPPSSNLSLPSRLQKAVSLFNRHKRLTAAEYQQLTGLGRTQAVSDLKYLESEGYIQRKGGGRSTVYLLNNRKTP